MYTTAHDICPSRDDAQRHIYTNGRCEFCLTPYPLSVGDNVQVLDYHTAGLSPYIQPCYVTAIQGDYITVRPRTFNGVPFTLPMSYKHIRFEKK